MTAHDCLVSGTIPEPFTNTSGDGSEELREEHGAWNREHGTRVETASGGARIHRYLGERASAMDGRSAAMLGGGC